LQLIVKKSSYNNLFRTSLLFQQFELELVTKNPRQIYSSGLGRPEKIVVRYMRKRNSHAVSSGRSMPAAGCPHNIQPPALAEGDGPIGKYRQWVRQFYLPNNTN